ncbi:MAG: C-GCAxxG-C-C family protein [Eubacterium sp.]
MSRGDIAKNYFCQGYNCSQAVAMAFEDMLDMDEKSIARAVSGFGGGISRMREVCGCVSGMVFVMSMLYGYDEPDNLEGKKELYSRIQSLANRFKQDNGSVVCRELLNLQSKDFDAPTPEARTSAYYQKRPCKELARYAADILAEYIADQN